MKLIVGLGNPGPEYHFTRHNFGAMALDLYAKIHDFPWQKVKNGAIWARYGDKLFIKPQDYYNESGRAVQKFAAFYKIPLEDILVICDDFNLPFGTLRRRASGSDGGNRGLRSISEQLGTTNFPRLRLGTNNPELRSKIGDVDFVLSRFTPDEKSELGPILGEVAKIIDEF